MEMTTVSIEKQAALAAKVASLTVAERIIRMNELVDTNSIDDNEGEFCKLIFGADAEIVD